jgi:hypothetical protein
MGRANAIFFFRTLDKEIHNAISREIITYPKFLKTTNDPYDCFYFVPIQIQIQISLLFLRNITFLSEEITINCSAVHKDWRKEGEDTQDLS